MTRDKYAPCPCDSKQPYQKCCRPFHQGEAAPVAEKLMRSRYSAYVMSLVDYIMDTTDRQNESFNDDRAAWRRDLETFCRQTKFDGLKIVARENGDQLSTVTFRAFLRQGDADASFSEKSIFVKKDGRWLYQSGEIS